MTMTTEMNSFLSKYSHCFCDAQQRFIRNHLKRYDLCTFGFWGAFYVPKCISMQVQRMSASLSVERQCNDWVPHQHMYVSVCLCVSVCVWHKERQQHGDTLLKIRNLSQIEQSMWISLFESSLCCILYILCWLLLQPIPVCLTILAFDRNSNAALHVQIHFMSSSFRCFSRSCRSLHFIASPFLVILF